MAEAALNEERIRTKIKDFCNNPTKSGLEAFAVKKDFQLKRISLSEKENENGKNFRTVLKEIFFEILEDKFLSQEADVTDAEYDTDVKTIAKPVEQN